MRPELFAVRVVNQYRNRDILAYLGLRYYLENQCAKRDRWATDVATHVVRTRTSPVYFCSYHFKEFATNNRIIHRPVYLPGPNEILTEAVLINKCSQQHAFQPLPCVFSYRYASGESREGIYQHYFSGFKDRHESIANYCRQSRECTVQYTDIKSFYPSISNQLALKSWQEACDSSSISTGYRELGEKLLSDHNDISKGCQNSRGLLTGPMFSHFIANLVLSEVDKKMIAKAPCKYWRYVDDIVLAGDRKDVSRGREMLQSLLQDKPSYRDFDLHTETKDFAVGASDWLKGENDFGESSSRIWKSLVGDIKRFLVIAPEQRNSLAQAFADHHINIPLPDYANAAMEASYLEGLSTWLRKHVSAPRRVRSLSVSQMLNAALNARSTYIKELDSLLSSDSNIRGYMRKRRIPKLRYYAGRVVYLGTPDSLRSISKNLLEYPELYLLSQVMNAVATRDVSNLLSLGSNAVQASAQILRLQSEPVRCSLNSLNDVEKQGLAILRLNKIKVNGVNEEDTISDPLNQFVLGYNLPELMKMKTDNLFVRELACLRGVDQLTGHASILDTAFDAAEELPFDVINQLQESSFVFAAGI